MLRAVLFACAATSIGALLAKVWGVGSMQGFALQITLPATLLMVVLGTWCWWGGQRRIAEDLLLGALGGLIGTLAYDVARLPFHLAGLRVFAPISAYGVWLAEASASSRYTDSLGLVYHFSNGLSFGIMYALAARGRHWFLAVLWACAIETLALVSPFGVVFALTGNVPAILIAYWGHVAYGVPLGLMVQHPAPTLRWFGAVPRPVGVMALALFLLALAGPALDPDAASRDGRRPAGAGFVIEGHALNPDWLRLSRAGGVTFANPSDTPLRLRVKTDGRTLEIPSRGEARLEFPRGGIHQVFVEHPGRSRSSFVMVEPVEESAAPERTAP